METTPTTTEELRSERFNKLIAFLIALVTVIIAVVTFLQSDASNRDDQANRDTKRYSLEAFGKKVSGDARVNHDYNRAYQAYYEFDLLAQSAEAAGDEAAVERYITLRDQMTSLSPLMAAPYFDPETGEVDIARYEADTYVIETTALMERFQAASAVKDAWDNKANTYIVHLTLLAVALFLYGMATTISAPKTRWIFAGSGSVVAVIATIWAGVTFARPVSDLRTCQTPDGVNAIDAYASGVGLAYQEAYPEAIQSFDQALACYPAYTNALAARAGAYASLGDLDAAVSDLQAARKAGDTSANTAGELAWYSYLDGRFDEAVKLNEEALADSPDELWIRFDLALAHLANGDFDAAQIEYQQGMNTASVQVARARDAGEEPPSFLWWSLEDAAVSLDDLVDTLEAGEGMPEPEQIKGKDDLIPVALEQINMLKSLAVALEYTGQPPAGELAAQINEFLFARPVYAEESLEVVDYEAADTFPYGTDEVSVLFDYSGMKDGQDVLFRVYIDDQEDPSWRITEKWELGEEGTAEKPISLAYSNTAVLDPGMYMVEMYVDSHLAQRGWFWIEE